MADIFELAALAKEPEGSVRSFSLRVSAPAQAETGEFYCVVNCPFLGFEDRRIYGVDAEQAFSLSCDVIRRILDHKGILLVDESGEAVNLPAGAAPGENV